jgi:group I intron endonuclease
MKICGIYGFHNTAAGKWYVGQSTDCRKRKRKHLEHLKRGNHPNHYLQNAFAKYNADSFEFHLLERVPEAMLDIRERAWIAYYDSMSREHGYNLETGGNTQKHLSEETRRKLSIANKGRSPSIKGKHLSEGHRLKLSLARKGKSLSAEHRLNLSLAHKGKRQPCLPETRLKISIARMGKPHPCKPRSINLF